MVANMEFRTVITWLAWLLPFLAGAAMLRFPANYIYEIALFSGLLLTIIVVGWWLIGTFYGKLPPLGKMVVSICSGIIIGVYVTTGVIYFTGYLGDNYPKSRYLITKQTGTIDDLTKDNVLLHDNLNKANVALSDAKKALSDPNSIQKPSYDLETSIKLQFSSTGLATEIESNNVKFVTADIERSQLASAAAHVEPTVVPGTDPLSLGGGQGFLLSNSCARYTCPDSSPVYTTAIGRLLVLSFLRPIASKNVKFDSYGDEIQAYSILRLDERVAVIMFNNVPRSRVIKIVVEQSPTPN